MDGQVELQGLRGCLSWWEENGGVRFTAEAENREDGLYKVYIISRSKEMLLGPLVPEKGKLTLNRKLSLRELEQSNCRDICGAQARLVFSFKQSKESVCWQPAEDLSEILRDRVLAEASKTLGGALICRKGPGMQLAVPFSTDSPFQLVPLICLGKWTELEGKSYLCFSFDREGRPQCEKKQ